jgi:hypothetical protein|eukprot:6653847-Prymnesium_polylepis.1
MQCAQTPSPLHAAPAPHFWLSVICVRHARPVLGDFVNWDSTGLNSAKDYAMWPSGGPGIVFSSAAVVEFSRIINEHAESMVFQNHDVWLHMLFGRSTRGRDMNTRTCQRPHAVPRAQQRSIP